MERSALQVNGERTSNSFKPKFRKIVATELSISVFATHDFVSLFIWPVTLFNSSRPISFSLKVESVLYFLNKSSKDNPSCVKQSSSRTIISWATSTNRRVK